MANRSTSRLPPNPRSPFMTTTKFLAAILATLIALSIVAAIWKPKAAADGRTPLVWVSDNNPARAAQIAAFNEENPGLDLHLDYANSDPQKIILQCSSGVGPDILDFGDDQIESYVASGILWDVTGAAKKMGFSGRKAGWPGAIDTFTCNGRQYGFPCNTGAAILIFNKNVFDYFGVPYPAGLMTWEQFIELAKKVNSHTNPAGAGGKRIFAVSGLNFRTFFDSLRGEFFNKDGSLNIVNNPELRTALDMHRDMIFKDRLSPTTVEARQMPGQGGWGSGASLGAASLNQFATGKFAMAVTGHWSLIAFGPAHRQQMEYLKSQGIAPDDLKNPIDRPLRLGAVLVPHFAGREPCYHVTSRVAGINARSPRREEALRFLQYLAGPTYSKLLNEGADFLPGNPKYASLGVEPGPPDLSRPELHAATMEAMTHGYVPRRSPFLLAFDVTRVMAAQISRMESNPAITTDEVLHSAQKELNTLLRRNLDRDPELLTLFIGRFGKETYLNLR